MRGNNLCAAAASAVLLCGSLSASADGFRNPPEGATALGKIGGNRVFADDASAATHNPANLTELQEAEVMTSLTVGYGTKEFEPRAGGRIKSEDNTSFLPNLFAAFPVPEKNVAFGVGLTTPFGRSTTFSKDGLLRYSTPYFTELYALSLNPSVAVRVNDALSLAVGVAVLYSEFDLRQIYPWSLATGNPAAPDGETRFEADGTGVGFNAALTWQIAERHRASLTYRSSVDVGYEGDLRLTGLPPAGPGAPALFSERGDFETDIEFPAVAAAGYGVQVTDRLRLEANVEWVQHSRFEQLTLDAGANTGLLPSNVIPADWEDNWTFGAGADYRLSDRWMLRAGYMYLETPIPSRTMLPSIAEEDQSVVSVGIGYRGGPHRLDAAYALGLFDGRTVENNLHPAYDGEYDFEAHLFAASYSFLF